MIVCAGLNIYVEYMLNVFLDMACEVKTKLRESEGNQTVLGNGATIRKPDGINFE